MSEKSEAATPNKGNAELTETLVRWLRLISKLLILIAAIGSVAVAWTIYGARLTALERTDELFVDRFLRIESEQAQMRDVLVVLQQGQAGMDAKLDILVGDRRNAP